MTSCSGPRLGCQVVVDGRAERIIGHRDFAAFARAAHGTSSAASWRMVSTPASASPKDTPLGRLLHRWFVQYNPFYVASAALVLVGMLVWQSGEDGGTAALRVAGVSELFAWSLVLACLLLVRIGQRRSALMLALLACLYEWDLGLVTETSVYLGRAGDAAAVVYVVSALAKVAALGMALRVRFSRAVLASVALAASGLVVFPRLLAAGEHDAVALALGPWMLLMGGLPRAGSVVSRSPESEWGRTVIARASRSAWALSLVLVFLHVGFWCSRYGVNVSGVIGALALMHVPRLRSEGAVALLVSLVFGITYVAAPPAMSGAATLIAMALSLRLLFPTFTVLCVRAAAPASSTDAGVGPYRAAGEGPPAGEALPQIVEVPGRLEGAERARAIAGVLVAVHVALWTHGWSGHGCIGASGFPPHALLLDLALTASLLAVALWTGATSAALPSVVLLLDLAREIAPRPSTAFGWGLTTILSGFTLFALSLAIAYRFRDRDDAPDPHRPSSAGS